MTRRLYKLNKQRKISGFFLCCIQLVTEEFDAHFVSRFDSFFGIGCIWHQCFFSCANEKDLRNKIPLEKKQTLKQAICLDFKLKPCSECCMPMKMEETECSETSAYTTQTLRNYPEESIQQAISHSVLTLPLSFSVKQLII